MRGGEGGYHPPKAAAKKYPFPRCFRNITFNAIFFAFCRPILLIV